MAKAITRQHGINAVSTDSLGVVMETVLPPEAMPSLFAVSRFNELPEAERTRALVESPSNRIDRQIQESTKVLPFFPSWSPDWKALNTEPCSLETGDQR
jgi:hypothetical protein